MNHNSVTLAGFVVSDAKFRELAGRGLAEFVLAYNRRPTKPGEKGQVDFVDVKLWGAHASTVAHRARKGVPLVVVGPIRQDRWDKDGKAHSRITVEAYLVAQQILAPAKTGTAPDHE
jgi:single-stranded DNA-binding protein